MVEKAGFVRTDFVWGTADTEFGEDGVVPALGYRGFEYNFVFDYDEGGHRCRYTPGSDSINENHYPGDWATTESYFRNWLANLRREIEAPDLWEQIGAAANGMPSAIMSMESNTPFNNDERGAIAKTLRDIRELIVTNGALTADKLRSIDDRLAYIEDATHRLGRKDWTLLAIGTLFNMVVATSLPPDLARTALDAFWDGLRWLVMGMPFLPSSLG
jgi:hypothetical protein